MKRRIGYAFIAIFFSITQGSNLYADADISLQKPGGPAKSASANVDISVVVPHILIFGVGATGDNVAKIQWTLSNASGVGLGDEQTYSGAGAPFSGPTPFSAAATAAIISNGGTGATAAANQANLPVFVFSNSGSDVTLTTKVSGGSTGGGTVDALDHQTTAGASIPLTSFSGTDGGAIAHPALISGSSSTVAHSSGIVNLSDTWTYSYNPATIPEAGVYEARISYVASTP